MNPMRVGLGLVALLPGLVGFALLWWNEGGWTEPSGTEVPVVVSDGAERPVPAGIDVEATGRAHRASGAAASAPPVYDSAPG